MDLFKLVDRIMLVTITALLIGSDPVTAQEINENNFIRYTQANGLSHNTITGMAQDSTGYIWMSTFSGLNRFNGCNFLQIRTNNDSASQPAEYLRGMKWLDSHRLVAYSGGLLIADTRTGETRSLFIPYPEKKFQYKFNNIRWVTGGPQGDLFVLTYSGFYHFDKNYRLIYRYDHYRQKDLANVGFNFGRQLFWLDQQRLLLITIAGMYYYDIGKKELKKVSLPGCPLLEGPLGGILKGLLDYPKKDRLFLQPRPECFLIIDPATDSLRYVDLAHNKTTIMRLPAPVTAAEFGYRSELSVVNDTLLYLSGHQSGFYKIIVSPGSGLVKFYPRKYFPHYYCRSIMQDRDQNLWIATNKGLLKQDNRLSYVQQTAMPADLEEKYPNIAISTIQGADDKLYVGTKGDGGVLVYDKKTLAFIRRISFKKYTPTSDNVYTLAMAGDSTLLVGANGPLIALNTRNGRTQEIVLDKWNRKGDWTANLYRDREDNIWLASTHIYKYDRFLRKFSVLSTRTDPYSKIQEGDDIREDSTGNIWLSGHGLYRYNTALGDFDRLVDSFPFIKLADRRVLSMTTDGHNNVWFCSYNNGLACYNPEKGITHHFTRNDGLPDNNIAGMIVIGDKLWIGTYSGISCLDMTTFRITSFGKEDGFPDQPISVGSKFFYDINRNKLCIGFGTTLVQFDPDIIFQRSQAPKLFIESIRAGQQKEVIYPAKEMTASWKDNDIRLTIGSINYFTSTSQRYAYRLLQDDSTCWQDLGTQNTISISSLPPGYHRIQVKVLSLYHRWPGQVKEIGITILPPFWKEPWFILLLVALLVFCIVLLIKWSTGLTRKKERAKTHFQKLKADEYKNQFELEQISNYFSSFLAHKKNVDEVLWDVAKNLIGRMKYADCMIYLWNEDRTKMVQRASYGPKGHPTAIREKIFDVAPGQGVVGYVMQTWEPLLIPNTSMDRRYRVDDLDRLSEICVPIIHNNELIGIIDSEHPIENYYKERDLQILTTIATLVGNKITQIESELHLEMKQKEITSINQQLAEAQLSALQTQMNPHFIFNSLNSIKGMILENEQQKASRYLSKFAQMIRITLNQSREVFTTLYENVEHLENYLLMEKLRFDDSFTFRITVDEQIDREETLMPTLMIQPLAENAIWHGLMPKNGEKKLSIRFSLQNDEISCTISDNGIGIRHAEDLKKMTRSPHQSVGLANLRNRIKIMNEKYDTGCSLEITDLKDIYKDKTGTRVVLRFKIITSKPCL